MGRVPCCSKDDQSLNRRAWTAKEDMILREYIETHGEGGWRYLPIRAGLKRCGKSCRLRWLNYLRPNIKRGNISPEEEELIIRMHRLLGNRFNSKANCSGTASRLQPSDDFQFIHFATSINNTLSVQSESPPMDTFSPCSLPAGLVDQEFITNCEHLKTNACQSISDSEEFSGCQQCCIVPVSPLNSSIDFEIEDDQFIGNMQLSHTDHLQEEPVWSMNQNNNCDNTQHPLDWVGEEYLDWIFECGNTCQQDERDWEDDYSELFADI
eukprot:Gb_07139 [translate_table: standard]